MIRSFLVCGAVLFLACTTVPLGQCESDAGCLPGLRCEEGVCVGCGGDSECQPWQGCTADRRCELRAGMCASDSGCKPWEVCGAGYTCELRQGACASRTDCEAHEDCNPATNRCVLQFGRCNTAGDCRSWEACGANNTCALAEGSCLAATDCLAHEACHPTTLKCVPQEGRCSSAADCNAASEVCGPGYTCEPREGSCVSQTDCRAHEDCNPTTRRCVLQEGRCNTSAECESWEACGAGNACELREGFCLAAADCRAHETCNATTKKCDLQPGRCNTADDCGSEYIWTPACGEDSRCSAQPPAGNDVMLWGTIGEGNCSHGAVSSILTPMRVQVGFHCLSSAYNDAVITPSGHIYYINGDGMGGDPDARRLKQFVPDAFVVDDRNSRRVPNNPTANDLDVPTPGCEGQNIGAFVVQAGTGAIAYVCSGGTYLTGQGEVVAAGYRLLAWNPGNYKLGTGSFSDLFVVTPMGTAVRVTGLSDTRNSDDARAHPSGVGFWLAFTRGGDVSVQQLWYIDNEGVATLQTAYGPFPQDIRPALGGVIDASGALHVQTRQSVEPYAEVIVRRPGDGSPGTVVYSEANAPSPVNYGSNYEVLYNLMHISYLFAGP